MTSYRIAPDRSVLWIEGRSTLHPIRVTASGLAGSIEANLADSRLDLSSAPNAHVEIAAEQLKPGKMLYDREVERRLEVRNFPRIMGELISVADIDSTNHYRLRGNLSLRGVTQTIDGEVNLTVLDGGVLQIEGEQVFDMRRFGLEPPKLLMLRVYPEVRVRGRVLAEPRA